MPEKVTIMVLKVDFQCKKCCKKVKKVLCKFPEIQDQTYDEKQNTVTIKVVSCCPEKLRNKICCKGGSSIKNIEIKSPEKKEEPEKAKETEKKKETEKTKDPEKKKEPENRPTPLMMVPVPVAVPVPCHPPYYPIGMCCPECCRGWRGWPCYYCGLLPRCYDSYYGMPVYDICDGAGCAVM